jgi:hypothetical protein
MPVSLGQNDIDRDALRVDEEVVLAAGLTAIGWVRSTFFPPCTARTDELSATTREKSSLSTPRSLSSSIRCSLRHTPAFCQARTRRQQVIPGPHPISCGSISHGIPDCKTNRMPVRTCLSASRYTQVTRLPFEGLELWRRHQWCVEVRSRGSRHRARHHSLDQGSRLTMRSAGSFD